MQTVEDQHQAIKLLVFSLFFSLVTAIEQAEFTLKLIFDRKWVCTYFKLFLAIDCNEIRKFGALFTLTNLDNNAHNYIFESVFSQQLI